MQFCVSSCGLTKITFFLLCPFFPSPALGLFVSFCAAGAPEKTNKKKTHKKKDSFFVRPKEDTLKRHEENKEQLFVLELQFSISHVS